jgi:two-component system chemotaxis response regulator CheB
LACDGEKPEQGRTYIAPADHHLMLTSEGMQVIHGPRENRARPSADLLFRTAATVYGPRVIGLLLSGLEYDGGFGLLAIHKSGGVTILEDPLTATNSATPTKALFQAGPDYIVSQPEIGQLLVKLVQDRGGEML